MTDTQLVLNTLGSLLNFVGALVILRWTSHNDLLVGIGVGLLGVGFFLQLVGNAIAAYHRLSS